MDDGSRLPWLTMAVLLILAAFFAMTETAISSVSKTKVKAASDRGDGRAEKALEVLENFDRAITTLLICTNIVHITAATVVTVAVSRIYSMNAAALSIATVITTVAVFFIGEMLPKSIAKKYSFKLTLGCSGLLSFLMKVFSPFSAVLTGIGQGAAKLMKADPEISVTEDELYDIIEDMTEEGTLDEDRGELISSALQFGDVTVESILTPRVDVTAVNIDDSPEEILAVVKETGHSRLPVYEKSIDNIIGILQIRKFIKAWLKQGTELDVRELTDEVLFVHQSANIDELLPEMSKGKHNMAVVTDNYGGTLGIVTIEDILEELVGEIWDEDDVVEENMVELENGEFLVDSEESVSDVFEGLEFEDPEENEDLVNTLMGEWAYEQFPSIPRTGDSFGYHGLKITISSMDHNRILKLTVKRPAVESKEVPEND